MVNVERAFNHTFRAPDPLPRETDDLAWRNRQSGDR
jgi:hypothetical protein